MAAFQRPVPAEQGLLAFPNGQETAYVVSDCFEKE